MQNSNFLPPISFRNKNVYSGIKIVVVLTRKLTYHLIQTYIPSALFVIVSWLSFLVSILAAITIFSRQATG